MWLMGALEAALDLPEDGDVLILVLEDRSLLQIHLLLLLAVKQLKPKIELRQDGIAEHFHAFVVGLRGGCSSARGAELKRGRIGLWGALHGLWRRCRGLLEGQRGTGAERERGHDSGNGEGPRHRTSPPD